MMPHSNDPVTSGGPSPTNAITSGCRISTYQVKEEIYSDASKDLILTNYTCNNPISKLENIVRYWRLGLQHEILEPQVTS